MKELKSSLVIVHTTVVIRPKGLSMIEERV